MSKTLCAWKMWARTKAQAWIMLSWNQENLSHTKLSSCLSVSQTFESPSHCPPLTIILLVVEADCRPLPSNASYHLLELLGDHSSCHSLTGTPPQLFAVLRVSLSIEDGHTVPAS